MARIPGFHPGGPGSIPGVGEDFFFKIKKRKLIWLRYYICVYKYYTTYYKSAVWLFVYLPCTDTASSASSPPATRMVNWLASLIGISPRCSNSTATNESGSILLPPPEVGALLPLGTIGIELEGSIIRHKNGDPGTCSPLKVTEI